MENIRIGNDLTIEWTILRNGQVEDLKGKDLTLLLKSPWGKVFKPDFTIDGYRLRFAFLGKDQQEAGEYSLILVENAGKPGMYTVDACKAFRLVPHSFEAGGSPCIGLRVETIHLAGNMTVPANGLSAYEIAVKHGFEGTEDEWIEGIGSGGGDAMDNWGTWED